MNKKGFIDKLSEKSGFTKKDCEVFLQVFMDSVDEVLSDGDDVKLVGFGNFEIKERASRVGRNPQTNEEIQIPARKTPIFRFGEVYKKRISEKLK